MNRDMRKVLADLELLSHGSVQSWNSAGGTDIDGPLMPHGELDPPHIHYRRKYLRADEDHRVHVLEEARETLREWRGHGKRSRTDLPSDAQILDAKILDADGWGVAEVAIRLRCTETRVRKVRLAAGCAPADGSRAPVADALDDRARVVELAERGLSERQIQMFSGVAKSTIRRILKRTA